MADRSQERGPAAGRPAPPNALERAFPGARRLPRVPLTTLPTPVVRVPELERQTGAAELWVKRDDRSGATYGGNKPRKLEYIVGDALARGRRTLLTFGGLGTHHGLATALAARAAGLDCRLVLVPQPVTAHVRRMLLLHCLAGASLHLAESPLLAAATGARLWVLDLLRGRRPQLVPVGGSSPLGVLGMVDAAFELAEQVREGVLPEPDWVFAALGSGGTAAGLVLGLRLAGLRSRVAAVLVTDLLPPTAPRLARLARRALRVLRQADPGVPEVQVRAEDFLILDRWVGAGYGAPTAAAERACRLAEDEAGLRLEVTYTGKALAALLETAREEPVRGKRVLYWHTYSSVDPAAGRALPDPSELPPPFQRWFDGPIEDEPAAGESAGEGRVRVGQEG